MLASASTLCPTRGPQILPTHTPSFDLIHGPLDFPFESLLLGPLGYDILLNPKPPAAGAQSAFAATASASFGRSKRPLASKAISRCWGMEGLGGLGLGVLGCWVFVGDRVLQCMIKPASADMGCC